VYLMEKTYTVNNSTVEKIFYFLFALSGFSGLIYESIWAHYLKLFLGCAAYAQTLVLIIFMGGMAIGAWAVSRITERIRNLLRAYILVELFIGIMALGFHSAFVYLTNLSYLTVIPELDSIVALNVYKWSLAALLILPQTILLGATFPLMSAGMIRIFPDKPGRKLAFLYFSNSIGAVAGVLVSGYLLIDLVGLPGTILTAGIINLSVALLVWLALRINSTVSAETFKYADDRQVISKNILVALLMCSCLTGTSSFMYEIGWIRMLSFVLGSSTHSFELMLSAFILGLALGGYSIKRRIDNLADPLKSLGVIQLMMGGFALLTLILYGQTFNLMSYVLQGLPKTHQGYLFFNVLSQGLSMLIMLPATICAGMTLPIITCYLISQNYGEGSIGRIYAFNTLGAIIGVLLAVQLIMPLLGVKTVIVIGAAIDVLIGLALLRYRQQSFSRRKWAFVTVLFAVLFTAFNFLVHLDVNKMASSVFRTGFARTDGKVLFHKDGKTSSVAMVQYGNSIKLLNNGKPEGGIGGEKGFSLDEPTQVLLGGLAWGMHDKAKRAATIGIGTGMTGHVLLTVGDFEAVDTVEIEPVMVKASRRFGPSVSNVFNDSRSHVCIEDAKTYFTNHKKKYDLIVSEPSNPWVSGVSGLFSTEFYGLIKNYINEDGLFVQWLQLYEISPTLVASVMKAISANFENYEIYFMTDGDLIILAGKNQKERKPSEKMFAIPGLKAELARIGVFNINDLSLRYLGNKKLLDPLFQSYSIPPNSDFYPIVDFNAVRDRFMGASAQELISLRIIVPLMGLNYIPDDFTEGTKVDYLTVARMAGEAKATYEYYANPANGKKSKPTVMNDVTAEMIRNVRTINNDCQNDAQKEIWLSYLHYQSRVTIPFLSKKQMDVIWKDIKSSSCLAKLPESTKDWINLYTAVGDRDFAKSSYYSSKLLPGGKIEPTPDNNYLVIIAMLSNLSLNNNKAATDIFSRYEKPGDVPIEILFLKALADKNK
jgi:spermidine synthase